MRPCAFLTMSDPTGYVMDDELAYEPLRALGFTVDAVPWDRPAVDWGHYDVVVVRSPWDYQHRLDEFLSVLDTIAASGTRLENELPLLRWNLQKTYLRDLEARGVRTVPTLWRDRLQPGDLDRLFDELGCEQVVIKPVVGAGAKGAFCLGRGTARVRASEVEATYARRPFMAQPLARSIVDEGEYSLFYFNGMHSHSVVKTPRIGDFRVQEEHGGAVRPVVVENALHEAGVFTLKALGVTPLYARADFVRSNDRRSFWLIELELVEPCLFFRMDAEAPERFARALSARLPPARGSSGGQPTTR